MPHKGTYDRGYLPHRDYPGAIQAITFRLADSVPTQVIGSWKEELAELLDSSDQEKARNAVIELHHRITHYEDAGHGSSTLRIPEAAKIVQEALTSEHGNHYDLIDWCIMPNHVHVLTGMTEEFSLARVIQTWKGGSARQINLLLNRKGRLWSPEFHDRVIRNETHYQNARRYIHQNPVKAGLCAKPEDWPHSSIGSHWDRGL